MLYVITFESGATWYYSGNSYDDALRYAESNNGGYGFTIEEYESEDDYFDNL